MSESGKNQKESVLKNPFTELNLPLALLCGLGAAALGWIEQRELSAQILPNSSIFWSIAVFGTAPIITALTWKAFQIRPENGKMRLIGGLFGGIITSIVGGAVSAAAIISDKIKLSLSFAWSKPLILALSGICIGSILGELISSKERAEKVAPIAAIILAIIGAVLGMSGFLISRGAYPQLKYWFSWLACGALIGMFPLSIASSVIVARRGNWGWAITAGTITLGVGLSIGAIFGFIAGNLGTLLGITWTTPSEWVLFGSLTTVQIALAAWLFILWNRFLSNN